MTPNESPISLEEIKGFTPETYEPFDLNRLVSFTVQWLQERSIPTTFENIVVAAFRMFPEKFALEGYPQYPDAARTNRALLQLRPKYRNWARGSVQKGFVLTDSGLAEVRKVKDALHGASVPEIRGAKRGGAPRTLNLSHELQAIEHSALFTKWRTARFQDATILDLLEMLNAYAYTPPRALRERISMLDNTAKQIGRNDISEFLDTVRTTFSSRLKEEKGS